MAQLAESQISDGGSVEPLTLQQRKARGFCTCSLKMSHGSASTPDPEPCAVHPKDVVQSTAYNQSHGLLFFDDRRNRYVTWEDAVEGMRQPRYAGASSKGLVLFTWMNLVRLLEALCYPTREPVVEITEQSAQRLIKWAGQNFPPDGLSSLIGFARGGGTEGLCKIFRTMARLAQDRVAQGKDAP
jgi:hypothetical protein